MLSQIPEIPPAPRNFPKFPRARAGRPRAGGAPRGGKKVHFFSPPPGGVPGGPRPQRSSGQATPPPGPPRKPEKTVSAVPTGRVIKYPKKCALFAPPGARGARAGTPGARGAPVCRRTTSADYPDAGKYRAQDVMIAHSTKKNFARRKKKKNFLATKKKIFFSRRAQ